MASSRVAIVIAIVVVLIVAGFLYYQLSREREAIERLITYVVEYARPVDGRLYGSLITLRDARVRAYSAARDMSLGLSVEVEVSAVDPR